MTSDNTTNPAEPNGVPLDKLRGTIAKLTECPELAAFRFTARTEWVEGTAATSTFHEWYGAGGENRHVEPFTAVADHPTLGHGHGPTPHEYLLHALTTCICSGVATTAANRGIALTKIDAVAHGSMDVRGVLGIDPDVRYGFDDITVEVDIDGDADRETLDGLVAASTKRSAVFDVIANPTTTTIRPA